MESSERDRETEAEALEPDHNREQSTEEPMLYCPVCSHRLVSRRCKLVCEQCGYFMSCADYY